MVSHSSECAPSLQSLNLLQFFKIKVSALKSVLIISARPPSVVKTSLQNLNCDIDFLWSYSSSKIFIMSWFLYSILTPFQSLYLWTIALSCFLSQLTFQRWLYIHVPFISFHFIFIFQLFANSQLFYHTFTLRLLNIPYVSPFYTLIISIVWFFPHKYGFNNLLCFLSGCHKLIKLSTTLLSLTV